MDPRSKFLISQAVALIAAGGAYKHAAVGDVIEMLMDEAMGIPVALDHPDDCDGCQICSDAPMRGPEDTLQ